MAGYFGMNVNVNRGQGPPAVGPYGRLVRGMQAGSRGVQQGNARQGALAEGARRFRDIGSEEAVRMADLILSDGRAAAMAMDAFGGPEKMLNQYQNNVLQGRNAQMQARAGAGGVSSADQYFQSLLEQGFSPEEAAQMAQPIADLYKTQSETAGNRRPAPRAGGAWKNVMNDQGQLEQRFIYPGQKGEATGQGGMQVYGPDGNLLVQTGSGGMVNPNNALGTKMLAEAQRRVMVNSEAMDRIRDIQGTYEDRFLTWPTQLEAKYYSIKEKAGFGLDPEEEKLLGDYDEFRDSTLENLNLYIKDITGAQMSEKEADRIEKAVANLKESPTEFKRGIRRIMKTLRRRDRMYRYMLNHGFIQEGHDFNSGAPPISEYAFKKVREKRLDAIYADLQARPVEPGAAPPTSEDLQLLAVQQFDEDQRNGVAWDG